MGGVGILYRSVGEPDPPLGVLLRLRSEHLRGRIGGAQGRRADTILWSYLRATYDVEKLLAEWSLRPEGTLHGLRRFPELLRRDHFAGLHARGIPTASATFAPVV